MLLLFERHPPETRRRPRRLSRWAALLLVIAVIMRSGHVWAQPATPSTLQQESLTLKDGTQWNGLIVGDPERDAFLEVVQIVRPAGESMYVIVHPLARSEIAGYQRVSAERRTELQGEVDRFRSRSRIEQRRMDEIQLQASPSSDHESLSLPWSWQGRWFDVTSAADEESTRRVIVRLEQLFRAFQGILPANVTPSSRPKIVLFPEASEYRRFLSERAGNVHNLAVFLPKQNLVVAVSQFGEISRRLQLAREHNERIATELEEFDRALPEQMNLMMRQLEDRGYDRAAIREEVSRRRAAWKRLYQQRLNRLNQARRRNDAEFDIASRGMFRRLYHEAFHAYLENYVFPSDQFDVPTWLNEGLAQVFEYGQLEDATLRVDAAPTELATKLSQAIRDGTALSIAALLRTDSRDFLAAHGDFDSLRHAEMAYLVAWGVAHDLAFANRPDFWTRLASYVTVRNRTSLADRSLDVITRFEQWVGQPIDEFERDWRDRMSQ
ncbi:MAG: DUF1570 domain-containing protein [Pirellulaceae bacterium]|nr:DUF1570 domain-containing protein [Planctomycetales bacterium]